MEAHLAKLQAQVDKQNYAAAIHWLRTDVTALQTDVAQLKAKSMTRTAATTPRGKFAVTDNLTFTASEIFE